MSSKFYASKGSSGWIVKREGSSRPTSVHATQSEAWAESRRLARGAGGEAVLRSSNGRIQAQNSYRTESPSKG
ncbi:MAG: DUF2188 domain-containing protein [Pseudorhodoplanes sp.]|nr:DUF2188 domain-containing protein [Pseudorhodoplanes sp.]